LGDRVKELLQLREFWDNYSQFWEGDIQEKRSWRGRNFNIYHLRNANSTKNSSSEGPGGWWPQPPYLGQNTWRLNNSLLHDQWVIEEIREEMQQFPEFRGG
jgi:hypothetical protein